MKNIFLLITFIAISFSSFSQDVLSINEITSIECTGGDAEVSVQTDATTNFNYLLEVFLPPPLSIWTAAGVVTLITSPPNFTISSLSAGSYRVILMDLGSIGTDTSEFMVNQPLEIDVASTTVGNIDCFGDATGSIDLITFGGTAPLTYFWSNALPNTPNQLGLIAGTYTYTIQDANGCLYNSGFSTPVTITQPSTQLSASINTLPVNCFGGNDGSATVTASGGTPGYSYSWSPSGGNNATASGLTAGSYQCVITDANGCPETKNITVSQPLTALTSGISENGVSCFGGNDGSATVTASGGTPGYSYLWSPSGGNNATASGLTAGSYQCVITDASGCPETKNITVSQPLTALTIVIVENNGVSCFGGNDGSATVTASGGTPGYSYSWSPSGGINPIASNLSAGVNTVTVTDANGCPETDNITITTAPALTSGISENGVNCFGGNDGSATVTASGGTPGYIYSWSPSGGNNATASGLTAGSYQCVITDANGCPETKNITVSQPLTALTSGISENGVSCFGGNDGSATVTASGGTPGYSYLWSPSGGNNATASGLTAGSYQCVITDANGCPETTQAVITEPTEINFSITAPMISCKGGNDGTATVNPNGGTPGYSYSWSPSGGNNATASGLTAGTYICTITDANSCPKIATAIVTEPSSSLILTTDSVGVSCFGGDDGSASVVASGGFPPYTYLWSNGDLSPSISTLFAGTYTCTVTDANNCIVSEDIIVDQPDPIIPNVTAIDVFCNGGSNGTATANPTGGTGPYDYEWYETTVPSSIISTTSTTTGLSAISYTVEVIDALNCPPVTETILMIEPNIIDDGVTISNVSCNNGFDGGVDLTVTGGNGNYTFLWSDNQITEDAINLSAGTYSVVITDTLGCSSTFSYPIIEPLNPLEGVPTVTDVLCFGESSGSISVSPQGGTPPYSCFWPFNGQTTFTLYQTLQIGTYTATVTDANGCVAYATGTIDQPDDFTITTSAIPASCYGYNDGSATAIPNGGVLPYTYNWSNGQSGQVNTILTSGSYNVIVYDNNNCIATQNQFVGEPTQITASISTIDILCNEAETGVITVNTTNGSAGPPYIYSWSNGHNDPINQSLGAGTYYLTITDGDGCFSTFVETLVEPTIISASLSSSDISVSGANDGTISASISGGTPIYIYSWSGPNSFSSSSSSINGLSQGVYTLMVQDANGCQQFFTQIINEPNCNVNIDTTFITPLCFGDLGEIFWQNSGGLAPYSNTLVNSFANVIINGVQYDYPPSPLQLPAGVYDLIVVDADSCFAIWNIPITTPDSIMIDLTTTDVLCNGSNDGTATAVITGGTQPYNIDWGAVDPNLLISGVYNVFVTDVNGCTSEIVPYTIEEPIQLQIDSVLTTLVSCVPGNDGTATTYASGGVFPYTYYWSNGQSNQMANSLVAGTYVAYVFDANNCMADSTGITITNAPAIDIDIIETPISCNGGNDGELIAILLSGSYPLTYSWLDLSSLTPSVIISSDSIISNLSSGGYQLLATDINGCFDQETVSVINPSSITFNLVPFNISSNGAVDGIINTTLISGGQAPYSFFWIGPNGFTSISQNLTNLNAGTYTLTITDANGCETVQSTVINEPGCNVSISLNTTQPLCFNYSGNITWTNSGGSPSYYNVITDLNIPLQLDDSYSSSGTYSLPVGNYALQVTDQYGCSDLQNIEITEPEILLGNYITSPTSCFGGTDGAISVTPTGGTNPYSINYGGVNANQLSAGVYSFILTDNNGCLSAPPLISYEILEPEDIVATLVSTYPVDCFGGSNGAATVTAVGGTIPYSYSWSPSGDITSTADNLFPGNQYVTITDANGCSPSSGSLEVNITQPALALTATITPINISCYGDNDGSATANPSGGTSPYSYLWSNGQITNQINNLVPGTYSCIITDANKCNYTVGVTIDQPTEILANLSVTNITCNGDVDGSAIVNPTGGIGPYSFVWYDNTDINSVSNLPTGFYSVTITDNTSCSTPLITFSVTQPDDLTLVASELNGTSCNGGSNGIAAVAVNGGTPFYTYTWLDSLNNLVSTDSFALNLSEATYSVIVIDDNGCIDSTNVLISSPLEISVNVVVDSTLCNGSSNGSATAIPTGGTGPYTYLWSGGQSIGYNATYSSLDALTTYYLTVTDFNNCVSAGNPVNIPEPNPILYTFSSIDQNGFNVSCNDSSDATITTHATGGNSPYQYSSNNILFTNDSTFIDLPSGWLSVYIIDDNGCTATDSVEVTEPDALDPNINIITSVTCSGGSNGSLASIVQGGVGGFLYTWSNANLGVLNQGLSEGTYSVVVTDDNGCIGIDSITLVADFEIETNSSTIPISCTGFNDGIAEMQPNGGTAPYTYLWNNGNTTAVNQGLGAGIYWCTISDANGCSTTDTVSIIESSTSLEIISSQVLHVTCNGGTDGSATITATGGTGGIYSFQWNDINLQTTQVAAGLNADTFIVSVTDLAFCTVYDTIIVNEPAPIYAAINHLDISCYGFFDGKLSATVSGGINPYSLSWSGPNSYSSNLDSISDLGLGEYILSIIDNNGCALLDTSVILEPSPLTYVASVTNPSCFAISDGEVSLDISGGNMPYSAVYASFLASYPTNNSAIISNLSAGSDTLYVYDANGCENFSFVNLINPLELSIDNINITNATCFDYSDGSVSVSVLGGTSPYSYQLSDDLGAIFSTTPATIGLIAGTYEYQIIDVNNCVATTMAIVEEPDEIEIIQEISCYGSILVDVLNTLGDYQIFWEGDISDSIFINDLSAGQYIVTVIDDVGCVKVDSFEVNELINYNIFDASCLTIPDGVIEIFDIYSANAPYSLSLNNSLLDDDVVSTYNIDNLLAGSYLVTLVDADSCSFSDSLLVDYIGGYDCINEPIIISPNSDGTNDNWHPIYDIDTEMEVIILNRWGEREFYYSGNSLVFEWDGLSNNGNKLPSTDYYYIIKFKDNNYPDRTGVITLIR